MKYTEIRIKTAAALVETATAVLMNNGIDDMQIDDPAEIAEMLADLGETEWYDLSQVPEGYLDGSERPDVTITVYVEAESGESCCECLGSALAEAIGADGFSIETAERDDSEWKFNWKKYYTTAKVGSRVVVSPTWEEKEYVPEPGEILIKMDPGMAFGTGTHETTSLAIRMLEKYLKPGDSVLDIGTGSGILSIAAAKLGAAEVLGVDIDRDAVDVANENIGANGVSGTVRAVYGDLAAGLDRSADIVVANLLADLVVRFSADAFRHTVPGGMFISSGILTDKEPLVAEAVTKAGFVIEEVMTDGEWCSIAAGRPGSAN
ncbi:MAG: 50S ribosomal protein L11 methyltransferase [Firmicutes bacterium]|nr:50S ribosomal protein L11 methyltransferase [Bacillota bacterium]